jgi:hypothetical protein
MTRSCIAFPSFHEVTRQGRSRNFADWRLLCELPRPTCVSVRCCEAEWDRAFYQLASELLQYDGSLLAAKLMFRAHDVLYAACIPGADVPVYLYVIQSIFAPRSARSPSLIMLRLLSTAPIFATTLLHHYWHSSYHSPSPSPAVRLL